MSEPVKLPKRRRWLVVLIAVLIFVSGLIVGAGGATFAIIRHAQQRMRHPEYMPERTVNFLRWKLGLTDEQAAKIEQILREGQAGFQSIRRDFEPRVDAELERARVRISAVLTPEQQKKWEEIYSWACRRWMPGHDGGRERPDRRHHPKGPPQPQRSIPVSEPAQK